MIELTVQTPTYLFAAINLLLLAYFNRFHSMSTRIRELAAKDKPQQVKILRQRLGYIQVMLISGILGVATALIDVVVLVMGYKTVGVVLFSTSVGFVMTSLLFSALEISKGVRALDTDLYVHSEKQSEFNQY
jgi:uncharacterized membrane protein